MLRPLCKENFCKKFIFLDFSSKSLFLIRFYARNQSIFYKMLWFLNFYKENYNFTFAKEESTMYL